MTTAPLSVASVIGRYTKFIRGTFTKRNLANRLPRLRSFAAMFGERPADELTPIDLKAWLAANADKWTSRWTRQHAGTTIRMAFSWATAQGLLARNPLRALYIPPALPIFTYADGELPHFTSPKTVGEVIAVYLAQAQHELGRQSFLDRRLTLEEFCETFGSLPLTDAKPYHLQLWLDGRRDRWKSNWSRHRVNRAVQRAANYCVQLGMIERNPFKGVTVPTGTRGEPMELWELSAMLRVSPAPFKRLLIALRYSGARPGEMSGAEWVHLDRGRCCLELKEHKTAKRTGKIRRVMLHPVLMKLLDWIRRHEPTGRFIFLNAKGGPWTSTAICMRLKEIRKVTNVRPSTTLYGLRHLLVTELVVSGADIGTVAALAGHSRIETTNHYIHVSGKTDHLQAAIQNVFSKRQP